MNWHGIQLIMRVNYEMFKKILFYSKPERPQTKRDECHRLMQLPPLNIKCLRK